MKKLALFAVVCASLLSSGCATIYLHDSDLALKTANAAEGLDRKSLLQPFDQELTYLDQLGQDEDQAIADFMVASRDRELSLLTDSSSKRQPEILENWVDAKLVGLVGAQRKITLEALTESAGDQQLMSRRRASELKAQDNYAQAFKIAAGVDAPTCKALLDVEYDQIINTNDSSSPEYWKAKLVKSCKVVRELDVTGPFSPIPLELKSEAERNAFSNSLLAIAQNDAAVAREKINRAKIESARADILKLIEDAKAVTDDGESASFKAFRAEVADHLDTLEGIARLAGWETFQGELQKIAFAETCLNQKPQTESKDDKCASVSAGDTTDKANAIWRVLAARAVLADTIKLDGRNPNWLLAANAIAQANIEDAKAQAERDKAVSRLLEARAFALNAQASALSCAKLALTSAKGCRGSPGFDLATASYLESWNSGAIPARILEARADKQDRISAVRRARAAAELQAALIEAAAQQSKLYGEGGVKPDLVARSLEALGLFAIAGTN